jgi:hypothetical protein
VLLSNFGVAAEAEVLLSNFGVAAEAGAGDKARLWHYPWPAEAAKAAVAEAAAAEDAQ